MKIIQIVIFIIFINNIAIAQSDILLPRQHLSFSFAGGASVAFTDYKNIKIGPAVRTGIEYSIFPHPDHRIGLGFQYSYQKLQGADDRLMVTTKDGPRAIPPSFSTVILSPGFFSNYSYLISDRFSLFGRLGFTYNVFNPKGNSGEDAAGYTEGLYSNDFFTIIPEAGFGFRISENFGLSVAFNYAIPVTDYLDDIAASVNKDSYSNLLLELSYSFIDASQKSAALYDGIEKDNNTKSITEDVKKNEADEKQPMEKIDSRSGYKTLQETINDAEKSGSFNELLIPADEIFQNGTARFKQDVYPELDRIISLINLAPQTRWRIEGHMDNNGNASEIKILSQERAKAVHDYFISKGIQSGTLRVYGLADNFPIGDNNSIEGRQLNRRIMLIRETPAQISAKQEEGTSVNLEDSIAVVDTQNIKIENETDEDKATQSGETFDQFILRGDDTFEGQSANLTEIAKFLLDEIVKYLKEDPGAKWKIESYMDNQGSADFLNKLSEERAKAVSEYLITKGLPGSQLNFEGFGSNSPIANNNTEEGRSTNRRVLIVRVE